MHATLGIRWIEALGDGQDNVDQSERRRKRIENSTHLDPVTEPGIAKMQDHHLLFDACKAYRVSDVEGLFILVKLSGAKSWRFKYRVDGKERLLVIGEHGLRSASVGRNLRTFVIKINAHAIVEPDGQWGRTV